MADTKISALTASTTPLAGTEVLPIVQSGTTKQVSVANLTAGRAISATELTLTTGNLIVSNGKGIAYPKTSGGSAVQPVFSATANTTQSISAATWTKVNFANELFDSDNNFASSTFTPTVAGYYQLNAGVYWASDPGSIIVSIYRSGNPFVEIGRITTSTGGQINGSALILADGTSHTFEIYCRSVNANTLNDSSNTTLVTFNGSLVRGV